MESAMTQGLRLPQIALSAVLCMAMAAPSIVAAQQGAGASAPKKKRGPTTDRDAQNAQMEVTSGAVESFKTAYEKDNEPDILVMVGLDRRLQVEELEKDRNDLQQGSQKKVRKIEPTPGGGVSDERTTTNNPDVADTTATREKARGGQDHLVGPAAPALGSNLSL